MFYILNIAHVLRNQELLDLYFPVDGNVDRKCINVLYIYKLYFVPS